MGPEPGNWRSFVRRFDSSNGTLFTLGRFTIRMQPLLILEQKAHSVQLHCTPIPVRSYLLLDFKGKVLYTMLVVCCWLLF